MMKKYEAAGATVEVHKLKLQDSTNKLKQMNKEKQCLKRQLDKKQCELNDIHSSRDTFKRKAAKFKNRANSAQRKLDETTQVSDTHPCTRTPIRTRSSNTSITQ